MRIAIIGGGATGALAAIHLSRRLAGRAEVVVVEPRETIGRGLAYSTDDPRHLLNVRVSNMSAFPDQPQHLHDWLAEHGGAPCPTPFCFISRGRYGDYVSALAREALASGAVHHRRDVCVDVVEAPDTVALRLAAGGGIAADHVILAMGNDARPAVGGFPAEQPWAPGSLDGIEREAPILIIGSGLTMADMVLSLDRRGHRGPIVVVSRRGLLPTAHRLSPARALAADEIPFGAELSQLVAWLRRLAARVVAEGADWRSAVDALRPHTQRLWRAMTPDQKRRFLRHGRVWWDVHRHRMAPEIEGAIGRLIRAGRVRLIAGRVASVAQGDAGLEVRILRRGARAPETAAFARVIDCAGLAEDPLKSSNPLLQALFARGALRPDALGIGLDVAETYRIVGAGGAPSQRIRAIGPLARAAFWECIAIPDIRLQCRDVAEAIADALGRKAEAPAA
ncbi:putative NAD(P)/FAD-binding protein YdhS [Roseiarcus fermentans]|uniref:Putative NAD(P)/FAD-binding protein YdhS n=1 Tax=Roseiarcus fermentans TaxID=1473586 RepID=A0A366F5D3_9HYPH|nr:FAD/NAD(P)-binding protein [Roseiarcus fermentans]RBP09853.1 putative NAD(P)/FAD-binding protein YdhS [Roseiarcus fermentans]